MFDRATLGKALTEQTLGVSGLINSDTAAKIGQVIGVKVLVSGQVFHWMNGTVSSLLPISSERKTRGCWPRRLTDRETRLEELISDLSSKIAAAIQRGLRTWSAAVKSPTPPGWNASLKMSRRQSPDGVGFFQPLGRGRSVRVSRPTQKWGSSCKKRVSRWWTRIPRASRM